LLVTAVFEKLGIPYYIGGSVASTIYGKIRTTHDIDLIADIRPDQVEDILEDLHQYFYVDAEMIFDAIHHHSMFNLVHFASTFKVDVFAPRSSAYEQMRFQRRVQYTVNDDAGQVVYVASVEDVILSKLEWYELGHRVSERQWTDILGVIQVQRDRLDRDYLTRWAAELGVSELLEQALREAE